MLRSNLKVSLLFSEGILEDYVVEGIDRKDVFFYQVRLNGLIVTFLTTQYIVVILT